MPTVPHSLLSSILTPLMPLQRLPKGQITDNVPNHTRHFLGQVKHGFWILGSNRQHLLHLLVDMVLTDALLLK